MPLGLYVEIINYTADPTAAGHYYQKLGLRKIADDVYSDGRTHLRVVAGEGHFPTLRYYGCDLNAIQAQGLTIVDGQLKSPRGIVVELVSDAPPLSLPHSDVMLAPETTRLGKFGELTVYVDDLPTERTFWEKCGFRGSANDEPYPWGIWSDDKMLIGIHQDPKNTGFAITYFDPQMASLNATLQDQGFTLQIFTDVAEDPLAYAMLITPHHTRYFLFTGDISKDNP